VLAQSPEDFLRASGTTAEDYAVVVTHDHALEPAAGAVATRTSAQVRRHDRQRPQAAEVRAPAAPRAAFSDAQIARLRSPLGMPIGADTPEEIAVSAMGEIIATRRRRLGRRGLDAAAPQGRAR